MASYFITAITMGPGGKAEHITSCSCVNRSSGKTFRWSPKDIAGFIEEKHVFQVGSPGGSVDVVPVRPTGRNPYIRTEANKTETDNLLRLPYIR